MVAAFLVAAQAVILDIGPVRRTPSMPDARDAGRRLRRRASVQFLPYMMSASQQSVSTDYPTEAEIESCLRQLAVSVGDRSASPFRVNMVRLHGKPPMYSVVILSPAREPLRQRIGHILARNFSLGVTSIMLSFADAELLLAHSQRLTQS